MSGAGLAIFPPIHSNYQSSIESLSALWVSLWAFIQVCVLLCIQHFIYIFDEMNLGLYTESRWPFIPLDCPSFTGIDWTFFILDTGLTDVSFPRNCITVILSNHLLALPPCLIAVHQLSWVCWFSAYWSLLVDFLLLVSMPSFRDGPSLRTFFGEEVAKGQSQNLQLKHWYLIHSHICRNTHQSNS